MFHRDNDNWPKKIDKITKWYIFKNMKHILYIFTLLVTFTFSTYSQQFTNYNVTLPVSGTYTLNLPVNTIGTLTINGQWSTISTITNNSKNGIFADLLSSSICIINGVTAMDM